MPNYITALIWKGMFHQQFGVINQMIQMLGGTPDRLVREDRDVAVRLHRHQRLAVGAVHDGDLARRAAVDPGRPLRGGARRRCHAAGSSSSSITLPSLKPALVPAVILSVIWTFNMFNIIYLVSAGEPAHSTEILITQAYKFAFEQYRYGYAAAYSMVIFAILLALRDLAEQGHQGDGGDMRGGLGPGSGPGSRARFPAPAAPRHPADLRRDHPLPAALGVHDRASRASRA